MKQVYVIIVFALGAFITLSSTPIFASEQDDAILKDIAILLGEKPKNTAEQENKSIQPLQARYTSTSYPVTTSTEQAFKIALEIIFGELSKNKQNTLVTSKARSSAYALQGTLVFITKGVEYCIQKRFLSPETTATKEAFIQENKDIILAVQSTIQKTKSLTKEEQIQFHSATQEAITTEFTTAEDCIQLVNNIQSGKYKLEQYQKTKAHVRSVLLFLQNKAL